VLAHHIARAGVTPAALRAYEADRLPRLRAIARHNIEIMNAAALATGEEYMALKRRQAAFEAEVVHVFDHACCKEGGGAAAAQRVAC
jgi:hypothetical protein